MVQTHIIVACILKCFIKTKNWSSFSELSQILQNIYILQQRYNILLSSLITRVFKLKITVINCFSDPKPFCSSTNEFLRETKNKQRAQQLLRSVTSHIELVWTTDHACSWWHLYDADRFLLVRQQSGVIISKSQDDSQLDNNRYLQYL